VPFVHGDGAGVLIEHGVLEPHIAAVVDVLQLVGGGVEFVGGVDFELEETVSINEGFLFFKTQFLVLIEVTYTAHFAKTERFGIQTVGHWHFIFKK